VGAGVGVGVGKAVGFDGFADGTGSGVDVGVGATAAAGVGAVRAASGCIWHALKTASKAHITTNNIRFITFPLYSYYLIISTLIIPCLKFGSKHIPLFFPQNPPIYSQFVALCKC
jgi:hypothetical protein